LIKVRLIYVDESGNTGLRTDDPDQPLLVLTALMVAPENVRQLEKAVRDIGEKYFGPQARNTDFELHGAEIYQRKGRYFSKIDQKKSFMILDDLLNVALSKDIWIGYVCINKLKYFAKQHIQQAAFTLLIERTEELLKARNLHGLLICDENQEVEQMLIDDLDRYKQVGTDFGYKKVEVNQIVDSVHFVKSNNNNLMQLCDVVCYLICRGKRARAELLRAYEMEQENNPNLIFSDWLLSNNAHKGHRYFYNAKNRITLHFSKDFPQ